MEIKEKIQELENQIEYLKKKSSKRRRNGTMVQITIKWLRN
jgi:hypothetical protein